MVADGLSEAEARARFYLVDRLGPAHDDMADLRDVPGAARPVAVRGRRLDRAEDGHDEPARRRRRNAKPTVLIGVTGVFGLFTEEVDPGHGRRQRARRSSCRCRTPRRAPRPPREDVLTWTDGRALVATGSPFLPVELNGGDLHDRPEQQLLHLPRRRPRRAGVEGDAGLRRDVHGRRARARRRRSMPRSPATACCRRSPRSAR